MVFRQHIQFHFLRGFHGKNAFHQNGPRDGSRFRGYEKGT